MCFIYLCFIYGLNTAVSKAMRSQWIHVNVLTKKLLLRHFQKQVLQCFNSSRNLTRLNWRNI